MSDLPPITVALFTYAPSIESPRHEYARATLKSLINNLSYEGPLRWHIADDGSAPGHRETLMEGAPRLLIASVSDSERRGYGASYNAMTQAVHRDDTDLVLCVEDDWLLSRPLDLTPLARSLQAPPFETRQFDGSMKAHQLLCIRLGYLGWTNELRGHLVRPIAGQTFLMLDPDCPEHHVFSAGPRLETVGFERRLGLWPEHCTAGPCELAVAGRSVSRLGVAWPLDQGVNAALDNPSLFAHIGSVSVKDEAVA